MAELIFIPAGGTQWKMEAVSSNYVLGVGKEEASLRRGKNQHPSAKISLEITSGKSPGRGRRGEGRWGRGRCSGTGESGPSWAENSGLGLWELGIKWEFP